MASPTEVVEQFCGAFAGKDVAAMTSLLADDVVYHNVGMEPSVGKEASLAVIRGFVDMAESVVFTVHHIAADGASVLTERTDTFTVAGKVRPIAVMGTFDVRDGLIVAWRDYFDLGLAGRMTSGEPIDPSVLPAL